jgi:hypothetical protein
MALFSREISVLSDQHDEICRELTRAFGEPAYDRVEAPAIVNPAIPPVTPSFKQDRLVLKSDRGETSRFQRVGSP